MDLREPIFDNTVLRVIPTVGGSGFAAHHSGRSPTSMTTRPPPPTSRTLLHWGEVRGGGPVFCAYAVEDTSARGWLPQARCYAESMDAGGKRRMPYILTSQKHRREYGGNRGDCGTEPLQHCSDCTGRLKSLRRLPMRGSTAFTVNSTELLHDDHMMTTFGAPILPIPIMLLAVTTRVLFPSSSSSVRNMVAALFYLI